MKNCIVIGANSDIYKGIKSHLVSDGWNLYEYFSRGNTEPAPPQWDLCLITIGTLAPVGNWWEISTVDFDESIYSNLTFPFMMLRAMWEKHNPGATVIWFAGPNPNRIDKGYAAYSAAKMGVLKLVEQMDAESQDAKFIAFAPGYLPTKIHKPTIESGWNNERLTKGGAGTSLHKIFETLKWIIEQPKAKVGGRNICINDRLNSFFNYRPEHHNENFFKLRRVE